MEAIRLRQRNQGTFLVANPIHHSLVEVRLGHTPSGIDVQEVVELVPNVVRDAIGHSVNNNFMRKRDRGAHHDRGYNRYSRCHRESKKEKREEENRVSSW